MTLMKYSPETIDELATIISNTELVKPSVHLNNLYKIVNLGMYDSVREHAKTLSQERTVPNLKNRKVDCAEAARAILKEFYQVVKDDIAAFAKLTIEEKMSSITQNRFLDVDPSTYGACETMMLIDKESVDMSYIYLTQPLRKRFRDKHKVVITQLEKIATDAKQLT